MRIQLTKPMAIAAAIALSIVIGCKRIEITEVNVPWVITVDAFILLKEPCEACVQVNGRQGGVYYLNPQDPVLSAKSFDLGTATIAECGDRKYEVSVALSGQGCEEVRLLARRNPDALLGVAIAGEEHLEVICLPSEDMSRLVVAQTSTMKEAGNLRDALRNVNNENMNEEVGKHQYIPLSFLDAIGTRPGKGFVQFFAMENDVGDECIQVTFESTRYCRSPKPVYNLSSFDTARGYIGASRNGETGYYVALPVKEGVHDSKGERGRLWLSGWTAGLYLNGHLVRVEEISMQPAPPLMAIPYFKTEEDAQRALEIIQRINSG